MSGLYAYFQDFLSHQEEIVAEPTMNRETTSNYQTSLASIPPSASDDHDAARDSHWDVQVWKEWRIERSKQLEQYMEKRMVLGSGSGEEEFEQDDGNEGDDIAMTRFDADDGFTPMDYEDDLPASQIARSQQSLALSSVSEASPWRRKAIPHIDETIHHVSLAQDIDMYTRTVNLDLCLVHKFWRMRDIKRPAHIQPPSNQRGPGGFVGQRFRQFEDDGPLGPCYRKVVSMEIVQLTEPSALPQVTFQTVAVAAADEENKEKQRAPAKRLVVFFYNEYAQSIASLVEGDNLTAVLSLKHVPARCIIPYRLDPRYFDCYDFLPYCICIGDYSIMKIEDTNERTRFDATDLQVKLAVWANPKGKNGRRTGSTEIRLTPETLQDETVRAIEPSPLAQAYKRWQELSSPENDGQDVAGMVGNNAPTSNRDNGRNQSTTGNVAAIPTHDATATVAAVGLPEAEGNQGDGNAASNEKAKSKRARSNTDDRGASKRHVQDSITHRYHTLAELSEIMERHEVAEKTKTFPPGEYDLYAAVMSFGSLSQTNTGDWKITVTLIDESLPLPSENDDHFRCVTANIFCKELHQLPKLQKAGDVIRMHRMALQRFNDMLQLVGRRASSYVVSRPFCNGGLWDIIPTAKESFTMTPDDHVRFAELWKWASGRILSLPTMHAIHRFTLADMRCQESGSSAGGVESTDRGDLTAMVAAIIPVPTEMRTAASPMGYIRLWDGTGVSTSDSLPIDTPAAHDSVLKGDPPSVALVKIASTIERLQETGVYTATTDDPPKSFCGRVANCVIWETSHWKLVTSVVQVGDFIRLRNIRDKQDSESRLRCLMLVPNSSLTPLPDMTYEVRILLEQHRERIRRKDPFNVRGGVLPLSQREDVNAEVAEEPAPQANQSVATRRATLARCIAAPAPSMFDVKVRVRSTIPDVGAECANLRNICKEDRSSGGLVFRFALCLVDDCDKIEAIVSYECAETLFGASADDVWKQPSNFSRSLRNLLAGNADVGAIIRSVELDGAKYFILERGSFDP